jgi:hypothetical protein
MDETSQTGALPLSPRGRGREAMTYGRVRDASHGYRPQGAAVSHLAELVRGYFPAECLSKAPSSGPPGHLLPRGRRDAAAPFGAQLRRQSALGGLQPTRLSRLRWTSGAEWR